MRIVLNSENMTKTDTGVILEGYALSYYDKVEQPVKTVEAHVFLPQDVMGR